MSLNKRQRKAMLSHADQIHEDDGVDPREFFKRNHRPPKEDRKAKQLCRQVSQTLAMVLTDCNSEADADVLRSLDIVAVAPAPDSSRLLVQVQVEVSMLDEATRPEDILRILNAHSGRLRAEIATSIHRKRVPALIFQLVSPGGTSP